MTNAERRKIKKAKRAKETVTAFPPKIKLTEAIKVSGITGRKADVVLIDEGIGNRVNMNYYGQECIAGAPGIFEGAACFMDHTGKAEAEDRPERSVWQKVGYYSNVRVETIENKKTVCATLTLDESESGEAALAKVKAALEFKVTNPGADHEYVGLSINAQGETEKRTMAIDGVKSEVNYVLQFIKDPFTSVDIVTAPARGGRFLALLESISGAKKNNQEANSMDKIKKLVALFKEAASVKTPEELKVKMAGIEAEAGKLEDEAKKEDEADGEGGEDEDKSDAFKALKDKHDTLAKKMEDIGGMVKDLHKAMHGEPDGDEKPAEKPVEAKKEDEACEDESKKESAAKCVKLLDLMLKEAGVPVEFIEDKAKLAAKPVKAIEAEIARQKKMIELRTGSSTISESDKPKNLNDKFSKLSKI